MNRQHHYLKIETGYYQAHENGTKTFEIRLNDRDYKLFDMVYLKEVVNGIPTGRELKGKKITYILRGGQYGLEDGYCILQLGEGV